MYSFNDGYTVYEGVIDRAIGKVLIEMLEDYGYNYYDLTVNTDMDISLKERVYQANALGRDGKCLLSIHSNAISKTSSGTGQSKASGFKVFISKKASNTSKMIAEVLAEEYQKAFKNQFKFLGIKTANHYITTKTLMPAVLVENLFFDNRNEAEYLMSEEGQYNIARVLFKSVQKLYEL
jgi:N-acetylmuramoyl-L-alanine amidase